VNSKKCRETFTLGADKHGWRVIPKLLVIPPRLEKGPLDVSKWIDMSAEPVFSNAVQMADWIHSVTGYKISVYIPFLDRFGNTIISVVLFCIIVYGTAPYLKQWIKEKLLWFALCLAVYFISMAGVIFNAIHNPPWSYIEPQSKQTMYFYPSARQQFVAEGIIMATLLSGISLVVVAFGAWIPHIKDNIKRRVLFFILAFLFFSLHQQITKIFKSKYGW